MKILINHKISAKALNLLKDKPLELKMAKVAQAQLKNYLKEHEIEAVVIGKDTEIHRGIIEDCSSLQLIINTAENNTNIDLNVAKTNNITVVNCGDVSARSEAELVFAHIFSGARNLHNANRDMPLEGETNFKSLQKSYTNALELEGKTLGLIGWNSVATEVAKMALGLGMKVMLYDKNTEAKTLSLSFANGQQLEFTLETHSKEEVLKAADFLSLHNAPQKQYTIGQTELDKIKPNAGIINVTNGKLIDEVALVKALDDKKIRFAGLDRFEKEPTPEIQLLMNPAISLSPNIAARSVDVREKESLKIAELILNQTNL